MAIPVAKFLHVLRPVATREMTRLSNTQIRVLKAREEVARQNVFFEAILYTARLIETDYAPYGMKTMFTNGHRHLFPSGFRPRQ